MLASLIIVFREVFEAGLIVGIVLAVTAGMPGRGLWIGAGLVAGLAGATLLAAFAGAVSELASGMGQELVSAAILATAALMLTWHNIWMARHGRELAADVRSIGRDVAEGRRSLAALAVVVGLAVLREGSEVVLFLYGIATGEGSSATSILTGSLLGLALGVGICLLTYQGLVHIPARLLFRVTTVLITCLAAGMAAQAVSFLARANWIAALDQPVWDSSAILPEDGVVGRVLHTLLGYTDQPTGMQLIVYAGVILFTVAVMRLAAAHPGGGAPRLVTTR